VASAVRATAAVRQVEREGAGVVGNEAGDVGVCRNGRDPVGMSGYGLEVFGQLPVLLPYLWRYGRGLGGDC
jgi:hypothetical protein